MLSVQEAKAHCRIDHADDDAFITTLIAAVESHLDGYWGILGRALVNQTWKITTDEWPSSIDGLRLPFPSVQSVTTVKYYDSLNVQQTWPSPNYFLREDPLSPYLEWVQNVSFPTIYDRDDSIEVTFVAGYGAAANDVPAAIRAGALMMVGGLYEMRESALVGDSIAENPAVQSLLAPFRRIGL